MNGLRESDESIGDCDIQQTPSGPLSGPSNTTWRRQRLMRIGSGVSHDGVGSNETTALRPSIGSTNARDTSYGTLPRLKQSSSKSSVWTRGGLSALHIPSFTSNPTSPAHTSPLSFRAASYFANQRRISAYDALLVEDPRKPSDDIYDVKTNGIRVWYSSFSSIDWLHDAIKDSVRRLRLRKRTSLRGRIRLQVDRSIGWLIVTIVGILTAIAAFLIVRSEQWLFDFKSGYCQGAWWKAQRFCCLSSEDLVTSPFFLSVASSDSCPSWKSWAAIFGEDEQSTSPLLRNKVINHSAYAVIAVRILIVILIVAKLKSCKVNLGRYLRYTNHLSHCV
jgi:chloride channel 3/4/5